MNNTEVSNKKRILIVIAGGIACSFSSYILDIANANIRPVGAYLIEMGVFTAFFIGMFFFTKKEKC